jgi:STE24 endopeptidase
MHWYLILFISLAVFNLLIKLWLNLVNKNHILQHRHQVPSEFANKIELGEHQKAADYTSTKTNFSNMKLFLHFGLLMVWIPLGGLNWLDQVARGFQLSEIQTGLVFFGLYGLISGLISLPESIYYTFVIEEKFGFNKTTVKTFIIDMIKQSILGLVIGVPFLFLILKIMSALGNYWWVYAWAFIIIFQFTLIWAYPKFIAPIFNKFTPLEDEELKKRIESLSQKINLSFRDYYVMNASLRSSHGNAYFTGFGKNKRIVFFDTLLSTLDNDEVEAVLAHELGHLKHKHILKFMFFNIIFMFVGLGVLGWLYQQEVFFQWHQVDQMSSYMALMLFSFISPVYTFLMTPVKSWFSRKNEYEADKFACTYSNGKALIEALVKMYKDNSSSLTPSPLYSKFYFSHPPAMERVRYINSCL